MRRARFHGHRPCGPGTGKATAGPRERRGIFLPIVLVCVTLLVGMVIAFQFVSASDYRQVARWNREAQADALVDLASDEIYAQVADIEYGTGVTPPGWLSDLLTRLDQARAGAPDDVLDVRRSFDFSLADLPATRALAAGDETMVTLSSISADVGPFAILNRAVPRAATYVEPGFGDQGESARAWDLKGPITTSYSVKGRQDIFGFEFGQSYHRDQVLRFTDTTPLANQFTLFSFHPPPTESYAFADLRSGGALDVFPATSGAGSRVMLRGPLVLVPDEAPTDGGRPAHLAGENPQDSSWGYPDNVYAGDPGAMATIPGPRLIMHPATGPGGGLMGALGQVLDSLVSEMGSRRATEERSDSVLKTKPKTFTFRIKVKPYVPFPLNLFAPEWMTKSVPLPQLTFNLGEVSVSLSKDVRTESPTINTVDRDAVSYFPAGSYFISPGSDGIQTFRVHQTFPSYTFLQQSFRGASQTYGQAGGQPWPRAILDEGDRVILEPVIRDGRDPAANAGVFGLYGLVHHVAKTYSIVPIREFTTWLLRKGMEDTLSGLQLTVALKNLEDAEVDLQGQTLSQLGLTEDLDVLVHRFLEEAAPSGLAGAMSLSAVDSATTSFRALMLPFGSYHSSDGFWTSPVGSTKRPELMSDFLTEKSGHGGGVNGHKRTLDDLLTKTRSPNYATVDPGWPSGSNATEVARWLCEDVAANMLKGLGGGSPSQVLQSLFSGLDGILGIPTLVDLPARRPQGAFGPRGDAIPAQLDPAPVLARFQGAFYPPKYRDFGQIVTRIYEDFPSFAAAEADAGGVIRLKGVVLIRSMNCPAGFTYRGRGIIVCQSRPQSPAVISGAVGPAPGTSDSLLVLVHRVDPADMAGNAPSLQLGPTFVGSVYSDNGVRMSGTIGGNLVTGLLYKQRSGDIRVQWDPRIHQPDPARGMVPYWTVEMTGEVGSAGPG